MNNDYDSSKGLPMGKKNPTGLLSVLITFMSSHRHPLIQFSILFLIGLGITNTSYAQAVISQSYGPVCENGTPIPLTGGPALSGTQKGRWTVESSTSGTIPIGILTEDPGFTDVIATFNPTFSGVAPGNSITFVLKFTIDEDGDFMVGETDTSFATTSITVNAVPIVTATASAVDVCENGGNIILTGNPSVGNGIGGWSGATGITNTPNSNNAQFDPRGHDGIVPLIYTFTDGNNCPAKDTVHVLVHNPDVIAPIQNIPVCSNGDTIDLQGFPFRDTVNSLIDSIMVRSPSQSLYPSQGLGIWSGSGVLTLTSTDSLMGTAKFVPNGFNGPITLTYTYTAGNGCVETITTRINVFAAPTVDGGNYGPICVSDDPILLDQGTQVQGGISMGTWDTVSYKNTSGISIQVDATVLSNKNPTAGTAQFEPKNGAGTYTLSYTFVDINGCEVTDTIAPIVVNEDPTTTITGPVSSSDTLTLCIKDKTINLVGGQDPAILGGIGTWTGTGVVDANMNDSRAIFNPNNAGIGTHTLIYNYENPNGCSDTSAIFITVNALPIIMHNGPYEACRNGDRSTEGITLTGSPNSIGGVWSGKGVMENTMDGTAIFEPDSASVDGQNTVILQYKYTDLHGCTDSITTTVTIHTPTVNATVDQTFCAGESISIPFSGGGTAFDYKITGAVVGLSDGTGNTLTGTLTNTGIADLTASVEVIPSIDNCEGVRDTFTITVKPLPTVNALQDITVCAGDSTAVKLFSGSITGTTYNWTNDNTAIGLTGSGTGRGTLNDLFAKFKATNTTSNMITSNIVVTPIFNGCAGTPQTFKINVKPLPTVTVPNDLTFCTGETTSQIDLMGSTGAILNWSLSGDPIGFIPNNMDFVPATGINNAFGTPDTAKIVITADLNGCVIEATDTLFIAANPVTDIPALALNPVILNPFCSTGDTIHLNENRTNSLIPSATMPNAQLGIWKTPTMGVSNPNPANGTAIFDPTGLDGNIELTYTFINEYGCSDEEKLTVSVENANANATPDTTYSDVCSEDGNVNLAGNAPTLSQAGFWTVKDSVGMVINAITATAADTVAGTAKFNPSGLRGTYTLIYSIKNLTNGCESKDSTTINIGSTVLDLGIYTPVCSNDSLTQLAATSISGGSIISGEWGIVDTFGVVISPSPITQLTPLTADLNPTNLSGYYKLFFNYTNNAGCNDVDTLSSFFIVNEAPIVTAPLDKAVCQNATSFDLVGSRIPNGGGELAKWGPESLISDPNIMDASITVDPSSFTNDITLTYTFIDGKGCIGIDSVDITLHPLPTVVAGTNLTLDNGILKVCESEPIINIAATPVPGGSAFGSWTPSAFITDTNTTDEKADFDPASKNGPYNLTYTYTDANSCINSSTITIDVRPIPTVFAGNDQAICEEQGEIILLGAAPNPTINDGTGVWSGSMGLDMNDNSSDNRITFNPANLSSTTPIQIKYTYTDDIGCSAVDSLALTVIASPVVSAGTYPAQCPNGTLNLTGSLTPNANGGMTSNWSTDKGTIINMNPNLGTAQLNLSGLTDSIKVVYTYTDASGCVGRDTTLIEIQKTVNAGNNRTICSNTGSIDLLGSPIPSDNQSGTWSWSGVGTNPVTDTNTDDAAGVFNPSGLSSGDYTITYEFNDGNGCITSSSATITVIVPPTVSITSDIALPAELCEAGDSINLTGFPIPNGVTEQGTWSGTGITPSGSKDGKATFNPSGLNGAYAIQYTFVDDTGCESYAEDTIKVIDLVVTLPQQGPACINPNTAITLSDLATTETTGAWSGTGVTGNMFDPSLVSTASVDLTYRLTHTSSNCFTEATTTIDINEPPVISLAAIDTICAMEEIALIGNPIPSGTAKGVWSGAGVSNANDAAGTATFSLNAITVSTEETLTYTYTDENGCQNSDTVNVFVRALPTTPTLAATNKICKNAGNQIITAIPAVTGTGVWTSDNGGIISQTNTTVTFDPSGYDDTEIITLTYTFTDGNSCGATALTHVITITEIIPTASADVAIVCPAGSAVTLTGTPTVGGTGVWTLPDNTPLPATSAGVALFDPTGFIGDVVLTYTFTENAGQADCVVSATTTVNVTATEITLPNYGNICQGAAPIRVIGNPIPKVDESGVWSAVGFNTPLTSPVIDSSEVDGAALFDPAKLPNGTSFPTTVELVYAFTDKQGCESNDTTEIVVYGMPTVTISSPVSQLCSQADPITVTGFPLPSTANNSIGKWTGDGITDKGDGSALFSPAGLSNKVILTYTYTDDLACTQSEDLEITILDDAFTVTPIAAICINADSLDLSASVMPTGGTWSGPGVNNNKFDAASAGYGTHTLTYSLTNGNGCNSSTTTTVTVVEPSITLMNAACSNGGLITLTGSVTNGGTGIWAIVGATNTPIPTVNGIASLDPTGLSGSISLIYTFDLNGCKDSITTQIVVNEPPTADAGAALDVCLGTGSIIITGSTIPTGGSSQWTGDGITDANSNDIFAVFNPANLDGPITVTYEITDANTCKTQDTKTITVKNLEITAGTYGAICESSDSITLTGTPAGGTWVGFGVSDKGNGTATFGPKGKNGDITVSYVFSDGTCSETASTTITVFDAQISAGTYGPFCQNDAAITVTGFPIPSGGAIGTWSGTGLTNIDPNNGTATLNPATVTGNTTLTYNFVTNGCSKSVTTNVLVNQSSTASITIDQTQICEGSSVELTATTTNVGAVTWTTSGIGSFSANLGNTTTYTPSGTITGTNRVDEISVVAVASTGNCPVAIASTNLSIVKPATVNVGQNISFCDVTTGTLTPATVGTGNTLSWSATNGTFDNNTATSPIYTANALTTSNRTDVITITASDAFNACPVATDAMNIRLTNPIKITEGATGAICEGDTITLTANYTNSMGGFTSQVNSNQGNVIIHGGAIKYVPIPNDGLTIRNDTVILINPDLDGFGACIAFRDTMIVDVSPMAIVNLIADTTICLGEQIDLVDLTTGDFVDFSSSQNLSTSISNYPANTTTITGTSILDTVIYSTQLPNSICPAAIDSVAITINTLSTIALNFEDTTICEANVLAVAGGVSSAIYNWELVGNTGTLNDSTLSNPTYTPTIDSLMTTRIDTLVLNLVDSTDRCKTGLDSMVITIDPTAIVNLITDTTICIGEQLNLVSLVTGDSVRFASSSNLSTSTLNYPNTTTINISGAAIIDTVLYSTQLAGSSCPAAIDSAIITINNLSTITSNVLDTTICEGSTVTLMADSGAIIYNWEIVGNAGTLNDSTIHNPTYTPDTSSFVTARMDTLILNLVDSTDRCNTGIDTIIITILETGTFSPIPDTTICANNTLALNVPTTGVVHQFSWASPNGTFSSTTDTNTVYTPSAITSGSGQDTLLATIQFASSACPIVTDTTIITVLPGAMANAGIDATICENLPLQLAGTVGGSANTGTWQVVGGFGTFNDSSALNALYTPNLTGNTDRIDVLVLTTNDPDSTGICTAATDTILITVTPGATVDLGQDLTMFNGQSLILTATSSEAVISSQWTSAPGSLSNSGLNQTVFTPLTLGTESTRVDQIIYQGFFTNQNCGSAIDTINVTVNAPQAISKSLNNDFCGSLCLDEVSVSIDANTGTAVVLANNINPLDTCGINAQFGFKFWNPTMSMAEPNTVIDIPSLPSSITFNCNDRGQQAVNVYVSDTAMNTQLCPIVINVKDNNIFCGERTIAGRITNSAGDPAVNFDVFVEEVSEIGGVAPSVKTDATGAYSITLTEDKQYKITPRRTTDIADGVTAFDNVIISRHILGLQPFVSPYQTIAADVNKSGSVTAFDIVLIRKIVLSKDGQFDNNTSWRFVDANYQFPNIMDAASAPFQESFLVTQTTGNVEGMDFIAVKIGDVNNTNSSNAGLIANAESRNDANPLIFETANLTIEKGKIYEVPFRLSTTTKVASYQFTLDFTSLELLDIQSGVATPAHFEIGLKERGLLTTCWSTPNPVLAKDNWFTLRFKATKNGQLSELLTINSAITPIEAYTTEAENIGIQLTFTEAITTSFDLFQNRPNPFKNQTIIGFTLPKAAPAKITILDVQGKVVNTIDRNYESGYNETIIDMTQLPRGVFYYRLETAFGTKTQKMMHIE